MVILKSWRMNLYVNDFKSIPKCATICGQPRLLCYTLSRIVFLTVLPPLYAATVVLLQHISFHNVINGRYSTHNTSYLCLLFCIWCSSTWNAYNPHRADNVPCSIWDRTHNFQTEVTSPAGNCLARLLHTPQRLLKKNSSNGGVKAILEN